MRRRLIVRSSAHLDVISQAEYFAEHSGNALANRFFESLEATYDALLRRPMLGKPTRIEALRTDAVREFPVKGFERYIVFYRSIREGIEILRVLHGARDLDSLFQ